MTYKQFKKTQLKNPAVKKEYDKAKARRAKLENKIMENKDTIHDHYQEIKKQFEEKFGYTYFTDGEIKGRIPRQNNEIQEFLFFLQSTLVSQLEEVERVVCNKCRDVLHSTYAIQKQGEEKRAVEEVGESS